MKKRLRIILKGTFIRNVMILASGTALAQLLAVLTQPIITRLYGPEAFGVLGVFITLSQIVGASAALTYPLSIVLPKEQWKAKELAKLSILISVVLATIVSILLFFTKSKIVKLFNIEVLEPYLFLIPLLIVFSAMVQTSEQWLIRMNKFKVAAKVKLYEVAILDGSKIMVGTFAPLAPVLIIITTLGNLIKSLLMTYFSLGKSFRFSKNVRKINLNKLIKVATEYIDFPKFRAPQEFISAISRGLPIMMLSTLFGASAAGFYSIGNTVLRMPSLLIGKAVGDVFYPRITIARYNHQKMTLLIIKATLALSAVGFIPFGVVVLFGPFLFEFVFGTEWYKAGIYAQWISFAAYFSFINRPSVRALPALNAQRFHLLHELASIALRLSALGIGFFIFKDDIIAVMLFSGSSVILSIFLIGYTIILTRRLDANIRGKGA